MATLIYQRTGGAEVRRCDAHCHNAKKPRCYCLCGGRYHGKRSDTEELWDAVKQTEASFLEHLAAEGANLDPLKRWVVDRMQLPLPFAVDLARGE